jgi:glyoxylase-like metal-dependent hydrolase (beta-lactamase superfamily II)
MPARVELAGWTLTLLPIATMHARRGVLIHEGEQDTTISFPSNALLCQHEEGHSVLVDAGEGTLPAPSGVRSVSRDINSIGNALMQAGSSIEAIETVVITHLDFDHLGGLVEGSAEASLRPTMPHARVVLPSGALEQVQAGQGDGPEGYAPDVLAALSDAGVRIDAVPDGGEIVSGVRLRSVPGHRAVQSAVEISDGRRRFLYLADAFHVAEEFTHPEWTHDFDHDPEQAAETRQLILRNLAPEDTVGCSHMANFGRVVATTTGTRWIDLDHQT